VAIAICQLTRVAVRRVTRLKRLDEQEQDDELTDREHERQPRRLPLDQVRVDDRVERYPHEEIDPDRDDPPFVFGEDRQDRGQDRRADQDRNAGLHAAQRGRAH
jgi:hypothetical protein